MLPHYQCRLHIIKYYARLWELQDCLVADAFSVSRNLYETNKKSWFGCIKQLFDHFKIDNSKVLNCKSSLKTYISGFFRSNYEILWKQKIFEDNRKKPEGNKLRTYRLFKNIFKYEDYLDWGTYEQRRLITAFRISSHKLEIERGRYFNIPSDRRFCKFCKNVVEDEFHFLINCKHLEPARDKIISNIDDKFKNFKQLNNNNKLIWLLSAEDIFIYNQVYMLLHKLFSLRCTLLLPNWSDGWCLVTVLAVFHILLIDMCIFFISIIVYLVLFCVI